MERKIYNPYEKYGIRRVINAKGSYTSLGGSISPPEIFKAMEDASKSFVHIPELQLWAGKIISEATGADAGIPTSGSSNAITLAAAACIMKGTELEKYNPLEMCTWRNIIQKLPMHTEGLKTEFIVQKLNWDKYVHGLERAGGRIIEVGTDEGTTEEELDEAYNPEKTAGYYFTVASSEGCLPLATVVKIAHNHDAPVIVDASLTLPPKENLRKYISQGVDLVVFSGGKFIFGPNNSGILAGRKDLIKLAHLQAYPFNGIGRGSKMSRETIVGFVTALNIYLKRDEEALFKTLENKVVWMAKQLNMIPGVEASLSYSSTIEEGKPTKPLCYFELENEAFGLTGSELSKKLREGTPSIELPYDERIGRLIINPIYLIEGDESIITQRIREIFNLAQKIG